MDELSRQMELRARHLLRPPHHLSPLWTRAIRLGLSLASGLTRMHSVLGACHGCPLYLTHPRMQAINHGNSLI